MKKDAFTMAEILLSLTIIGVVAAITLPSLTGNINERTWNTQRKALYARLSQAIALMPALNGFGTVTAASGTSGTESYVAAVDTAAETFVASGLSKVLKINNVCDNAHLADCGVPTNFNTTEGVQSSFPTTLSALNEGFANINAVAFETQNGESIVAFYNPNCQGDMQETGEVDMRLKMCVNFVYDLNGAKGPNTLAKDIGFITVFYPTDSEVTAPNPYFRTLSSGYAQYEQATRTCRNLEGSEYRVPNRFEAAALSLNKYFFGNAMTDGYAFWTVTPANATDNWVNKSFGVQDVRPRFNSEQAQASVFCIKR